MRTFATRRTLALATTLVVGVSLTTGITAANAANTKPAPQETRAGLDLAALKPIQGEVETHGNPKARAAGGGLFRAAPVAYSNEKFAVTPGSQGKVASCVSWAVGYSGYGSLMTKQKIDGFPTAPMFLHSQLSGDKDTGTTVPAALDMLMEQGIPMAKNYWQGPTDWATLPTRAQRAEAEHYKLSGYYRISPWNQNAKARVKDAVAKNMPVIASFRLHENFRGMDSQTASDYSYWPDGKETDGHAMEIIAYNQKGVLIQNSWGTKWGNGGRFTMSWDALFNSDTLVDLEVMGDIDYIPFAPAPSTSASTTKPTSTTTPTSTSTTTSSTTTPSTTEPAGPSTTIIFFPRPTATRTR